MNAENLRNKSGRERPRITLTGRVEKMETAVQVNVIVNTFADDLSTAIEKDNEVPRVARAIRGMVKSNSSDSRISPW